MPEADGWPFLEAFLVVMRVRLPVWASERFALAGVLTLVALLSGGLTGCATIVKGTTQPIPIASEPAGARVNVDGRPAGTTPTTVTLERKHSHMVTVELDGYETESVAITNNVGGAVAGNIIAGGLIGWGVDATSGAQYNLHPDTVNLRLHRKSDPGAPVAVVDNFAGQLAKLDELRANKRLSDDEYAKLRDALVRSYSSENRPSPIHP